MRREGSHGLDAADGAAGQDSTTPVIETQDVETQDVEAPGAAAAPSRDRSVAARGRDRSVARGRAASAASAAAGALASKPGRIVAQAVVLTAVVSGTLAYADTGRVVRLSVDGVTRELNAEADTVRAFLAEEGISYSDRDLVAPSPDAQLREGDQVVVRFARPLTVDLDGQQRTYWTTELTVDAALAALGIRADGARMSASRSEPLGRSGLALALSTPKPVTLVADGRARRLTSTAPTVKALLDEQGVRMDNDDTVSAAPTTRVVKGLTVAVTRIDKRKVTVTEQLPAPMRQQRTSSLTKGQRKVVKAGRPGTQRVTYALVLANGKQTSRQRVDAQVVTAPVPGLVHIGTAKKAAASGSTGAGARVGGRAEGLNWAALARCESGGNPRAVNPAGYYGLYQFSLSTWRSVGGSGNPVNASPGEQTMRAKILYNKAGAGQWGCGRHLFD